MGCLYRIPAPDYLPFRIRGHAVLLVPENRIALKVTDHFKYFSFILVSEKSGYHKKLISQSHNKVGTN
jgi:hypothetical protein